MFPITYTYKLFNIPLYLKLFIVIVGILIIVLGIIFSAQSKSMLGPSNSFMYSNPSWTINGSVLIIIGIIILVLSVFSRIGIFVRLKRSKWDNEISTLTSSESRQTKVEIYFLLCLSLLKVEPTMTIKSYVQHVVCFHLAFSVHHPIVNNRCILRIY